MTHWIKVTPHPASNMGETTAEVWVDMAKAVAVCAGTFNADPVCFIRYDTTGPPFIVTNSIAELLGFKARSARSVPSR